jgi:hypothetical protein
MSLIYKERQNMEVSELKTFAVKLAAVAEHLESRLNQATQQLLQSAQAISHSAQQALASSDRISAQAIDSFRKEASGAIVTGVSESVEHIDRVVRSRSKRPRLDWSNAYRFQVACRPLTSGRYS